MKHLNKEELEKLKVGDKLHCIIEGNCEYYLQVLKIKLSRNGYRLSTNLFIPINTPIKFMQDIDKIFLNFTINGTFYKDGIHNPGKNYLKRKYYLCQF